MWIDNPHPIVIAHRGDKAHAPENTLAAFVLAAENGADAIEFDVKLTADSRVIVLHDQTVDRTTDGTGKVSRLSFTEVRKLDAGGWFSEQFRGEPIPLLDEVFEEVGKRLYMNVELTNYSTPGDALVPKVIELVRRYAMQERVLFSSFLSRNLIKAHLLLPQVPCGLLCMPGILGFLARTFAWRRDFYALHPHLTDVGPGLVERVHAAGKRLNVWTVNDEDDLKRMIGLRVDAIFTDDPGMALRLLGRSQ